MTHYRTTIASPVGDLLLVASDAALAMLIWAPDADRRHRLPAAADAPDHPVLCAATTQLAEYFAGTRERFDLALAPVGTPFQRQVWRLLDAIPFGETRSYRDIARALGQPTATRAVGAANGRNPLAIVTPCHRVIGADGSLTGFGGGLDNKRFLLAHERRDLFAASR